MRRYPWLKTIYLNKKTLLHLFDLIKLIILPNWPIFTEIAFFKFLNFFSFVKSKIKKYFLFNS